MNAIVTTLMVSKMSYIYGLEGDIVPIVNIFPALNLPDGTTIDKFPLLNLMLLGDASAVTGGDSIRLTMDLQNREISPTLEITTYSEKPRFDHSVAMCPVCGDMLLPPTAQFSMGRCVNRSCMGQTSANVLHFLGQMPINLTPDFLKILAAVISRGSVPSVYHLFTLRPEDIITPYIYYTEVQMFLYMLHSIRGKVGVIDMLRGLRIPYWSNPDYQELAEYLQKCNITWNTLSQLFQVSGYPDKPDLPWIHFNEVICRPCNMDLILMLANILQV